MIESCSQVIGEPSVSLMRSMSREEKERVEKQREALGDIGLKRKEKALESAIRKNEVSDHSTLILDTSHLSLSPRRKFPKKCFEV